MRRILVSTRRFGMALIVACLGALAVDVLAAGQSFTFLQSGFTQGVFGVALVSGELGGVAFAPDGDAWVDDCRFFGSSLHRFDLQSTTTANGTTFHPGSIVTSNAGCGLTNHPNGKLYSNIDNGTNGVAELDAATGAPIRTFGPRGNALGITVDPITTHVVYVGQDCRFTATCTIFDLDPVTGISTNFAVLSSADAQFVDGIAFEPTGRFLFLSNRSPSLRLTVLRRDGSLVQHAAMTSEPDGIAFHAGTPRFVVTNNTDGTMTRFDFPGDDYTATPTQSVFGSGGFRGDLSQVGGDGCMYVTQDGTRYDDGTVTVENSLVRICSGFAQPPGVQNPPVETQTHTYSPGTTQNNYVFAGGAYNIKPRFDMLTDTFEFTFAAFEFENNPFWVEANFPGYKCLHMSPTGKCVSLKALPSPTLGRYPMAGVDFGTKYFIYQGWQLPTTGYCDPRLLHLRSDGTAADISTGYNAGGTTQDPGTSGEDILWSEFITADRPSSNSTTPTFLMPRADGSSLFKSGRTVPVKVKLSPNVANADLRLELSMVSSDLSGIVVEDVIASGNSNTDNMMRYDAGSQTYMFNLKLRKADGSKLDPGTYVLTLTSQAGLFCAQIVRFSIIS